MTWAEGEGDGAEGNFNEKLTFWSTRNSPRKMKTRVTKDVVRSFGKRTFPLTTQKIFNREIPKKTTSKIVTKKIQTP